MNVLIAGGWRGGLIMAVIMAPGYLLGLHSTGKYLVERAHRRLTGARGSTGVVSGVICQGCDGRGGSCAGCDGAGVRWPK